MARNSWIKMTATRGDGSVDWYRGVVTPRVSQIVGQLNDRLDGMIHVDPHQRVNDEPKPHRSEVPTIADEQELINVLAWWCNGCPTEPSEYEFLPDGAQPISEG